MRVGIIIVNPDEIVAFASLSAMRVKERVKKMLLSAHISGNNEEGENCFFSSTQNCLVRNNVQMEKGFKL